MNRKSLKLRELTTFYGAQDWLTNTEMGQSYLYIAFPEASYRIINAMLDGDDKALEILRNMQPVSLRPVLKDFNHFIEQSARHSDVSDIVRYIQVFDDLNEAGLYGNWFISLLSS